MANELTQIVQVKINDGAGYVQQSPRHTVQTDVAGTKQAEFFQLTVATSVTALSFAKLSTAGVVLLTNLEAAGGNNVELKRNGDATYWLEIEPQETVKLRIKSGQALDLIAITAAVQVQVEGFEN